MTAAAFDPAYLQVRQPLPDSNRLDLASLLQQAAGGDSEAAYQAGRLLLAENTAENALPLLQQAADAGHLHAAYLLLQTHETRGTPFHTQLQQYAWLAERGQTDAQLRLLDYYSAQNDPQARYWAQQAAAQYHPYAQFWLGQHSQLHAEHAAARDWFHQAAAQDFAAAHWQLGQIYCLGIGTAADPQQAAFHLQRAAEQGYRAAPALLADLLAAQNRTDATGWYQQAAEQGDCHAAAALAQLYLTGRLVERDVYKACQYAKTAAATGHPEALQLLGDIYRYGLGVKSDAELAQSYYRQAAEQGNLTACQKLLSDAALHRPQDYAAVKAAALFHQEAEQNYRRAQACHYAIGRPADYARARKLYLAAAENHHPGAAAQLGLMYYRGQGIGRDMQQAAYWFEQAADQGDAMAQYHLAQQYYRGQGVAFSRSEACRRLQQAIDNGYDCPSALAAQLQQWQSGGHHHY